MLKTKFLDLCLVSKSKILENLRKRTAQYTTIVNFTLYPPKNLLQPLTKLLFKIRKYPENLIFCKLYDHKLSGYAQLYKMFYEILGPHDIMTMRKILLLWDNVMNLKLRENNFLQVEKWNWKGLMLSLNNRFLIR